MFFTVEKEEVVFRKYEEGEVQGKFSIPKFSKIVNDQHSIKIFTKEKKKIELLCTNSKSIEAFVSMVREVMGGGKKKKEEKKKNALESSSCEKNDERVKTLEMELESKNKEIERLYKTVEDHRALLQKFKNIIEEKLGIDALCEVSEDVLADLKTFKIDHEQIKRSVDQEFQKSGLEGQIQRDTLMWKSTFRSINPLKKGILKRLLVVLRYGGLLYRVRRSTEWNWWRDKKWPVVTALSHGGRVLIQLPKCESEDYDTRHAFFKWLLLGDSYHKKKLSEVMTTSTSGMDARKEKKVVFKRLGATHSVQYLTPDDPSIAGKVGLLQSKGEFYDLLIRGGRQKICIETKTMGLSLRDTKVFVMGENAFVKHRHWGMNIPLGGENNRGLDGKLISGDGSHGHMYMYYQSPNKRRWGALLVGIEGSEPGKMDSTGNKHSFSARSNVYSPTYGYKFFSKSKKDLRSCAVPDKYNGMLVDLSVTGWKFLTLREEEWRDEMVFQTSEEVVDVKRDREEIKKLMRRIKRHKSKSKSMLINRISKRFSRK